MTNRIFSAIASLFLILQFPATALAHSLSDSYLNFEFENNVVTGTWSIAIQDLELAVGLDANNDAQITWGEILQKQEVLRTHLLSRLELRMAGQDCSTQFGSFMLEELNAGVFLHVPVNADCVATGPLQVNYSLLFDIDSSHRGILTAITGSDTHVRLFSPATPNHTVDAEDISLLANLWVFLLEGIWHIWIGLDHILFLCALLVPIVIGKSRALIDKVTTKSLFYEILVIVTAFTIAHSITLIVATLEIIVLPSRFVESVIALSVAVSGLNIIWPVLRGHMWKLAFGFGLIHGFGFAGVLSDLSLPTNLFVSSLLSFNVGVEIGQLAIVLVLVPVLLLLGRAEIVRKMTLIATGIGITGFGVLWFLERALNVSVFSV